MYSWYKISNFVPTIIMIMFMVSTIGWIQTKFLYCFIGLLCFAYGESAQPMLRIDTYQSADTTWPNLIWLSLTYRALTQAELDFLLQIWLKTTWSKYTKIVEINNYIRILQTWKRYYKYYLIFNNLSDLILSEPNRPTSDLLSKFEPTSGRTPNYTKTTRKLYCTPPRPTFYKSTQTQPNTTQPILDIWDWVMYNNLTIWWHI